jgi:hypothetical protein
MYTWLGWMLKKGSMTDILSVSVYKETPDCAETYSNFRVLLCYLSAQIVAV